MFIRRVGFDAVPFARFTSSVLKQKVPEIVKAPEGMSCVDAVYALWLSAPFTKEAIAIPGDVHRMTRIASKAEHFADLLRYNIVLGNVFGKVLKVDFRNFPNIDVTKYNESHGQGEAQKALLSFDKNKVVRLDPNNLYKFEELKKTYEKMEALGWLW